MAVRYNIFLSHFNGVYIDLIIKNQTKGDFDLDDILEVISEDSQYPKTKPD